uniref:Immunoglobulin C1-set domain-containing protein n=1 Tax=Takifugu rubripes TaxID=31033 RepID=H2S7D9_TAKRU
PCPLDSQTSLSFLQVWRSVDLRQTGQRRSWTITKNSWTGTLQSVWSTNDRFLSVPPELPSVSLLQKTPSSPVSCHATGFYPDRATLSWRKGEEELHEDVDHGEMLLNPDGTFQMSVDLNVSSCCVPVSSSNHPGAAVIIVILVVLLLPVGVTIRFCIRTRNNPGEQLKPAAFIALKIGLFISPAWFQL